MTETKVINGVEEVKIEELPAGTILEIETEYSLYILTITKPDSREAVVQGGQHYLSPAFVECPEYIKERSIMRFRDAGACPVRTSDVRNITVILSDKQRACAIIGLAYLLSQNQNR